MHNINNRVQPPAGGRLRESVVKAGIAKLNLKVLTDHLGDVACMADAAKALVGHIRRASGLILPRADAANEKRRDAFLDGLVADLQARAQIEAASALDGAILQLKIAEDGYRRILAALQQCAISHIPPELRLSAVLGRAADQYRHLNTATMAAMARQSFIVPQSISLRDRENRPISPDGVLEALVSGAGATLVMEAFNNSWFQGDVILVPKLPCASRAEREQAGSNEMLAQSWRLWRRTEERARFADAQLITHAAPDLPPDVPQDVSICYELQTADDRWLAFAAQLRMSDISAQNYAEMMHKYSNQSRVGDLSQGVPLAPDAFVSLEEAQALGELSQTLGYAIKDDQERIEGLRILEWLRGFATLRVLAIQHQVQPAAGVDPCLAEFTHSALIAALERGGLAPLQARLFLDQVTFRKTSRDLFDAPLIQLTGARKMLFGPALLSQNHAGVLLSVFAAKEVAFDRKGTAFENRVVELLRRQGLDARSIKVIRDGSEYEFDVVVPWGDFIFLFECKNRSLPGNHPVQAYHFAQEARSHAKQVQRLAAALQRWPEILKEEFGTNLSDKVIIPCVLNNLPYACSGRSDGVYFYDWSALSRFFSSGQMSINAVHTLGDGSKHLQSIPTFRIWAGERPTPEDLIGQMDDPVQLRTLRHHTRQYRMIFTLDPQTVTVVPEISREDVTPMTIADLAGIPRRNVKLKLDRAAKKARKSRQRAERDQRR